MEKNTCNLYHYGQVYVEEKIHLLKTVLSFNTVSDSINISNVSAIKDDKISNEFMCR